MLQYFIPIKLPEKSSVLTCSLHTDRKAACATTTVSRPASKDLAKTQAIFHGFVSSARWTTSILAKLSFNVILTLIRGKMSVRCN